MTTYTFDSQHPSATDTYAGTTTGTVLGSIQQNTAVQSRMFDPANGDTINNLVDQMVRINSASGILQKYSVSGSTWSAMPLTGILGFTAAPLASPTFTGVPAAPTAAPGTNTTQLATTQFVATSYAPLASPTFTGTIAGASETLSGTLGVTGLSTLGSLSVTGATTLNGATVGGPSAAGTNLIFNGAAGYSRVAYFQTNSGNRWAVYTNGTAESGSNVGSDFQISCYNDSGAFLYNPVTITRSTGQIQFNNKVTVAGTSLVISGYAGSAQSSGFQVTNSGSCATGWNDTSQTTDTKAWDILVSAGIWQLRCINDAGTAANTAITVARSGYTISNVYIQAPLSVTGACSASGGFNNTSAREAKKNIKRTKDGARNRIRKWLLTDFQYKQETGKFRHTGLILDEAPKNLHAPDGKSISVTNMIGELAKAFQELDASVRELEAA